MTTHFAIATTRRKSPAYCLKGKWESQDELIAGRPSGINVFVRWYDDLGTDFLDFSETLHAVRNVSNNGYIAWSAPSHPRIGVIVYDAADLNHYDVTINVDLFGWILESHTFLDVDVTHRAPWGSTTMTEIWTAHQQYLEVRLLA